MSFEVYKEELGERIDPAILDKYLNIPTLAVGKIEVKYAEIIRLNTKLTVDSNPYLAMTFRDVNGRVIYGSFFDHTLSTQDLLKISTLKRIYAEIKYEPQLYRGNLHLTIKSLNILQDSEVSSELADAFTPLFKDADKLYDKIVSTDFGRYSTIMNHTLIKSGMFNILKQLSLEEYGSAKIGSITELISNTFDELDKFAVDADLAKSVFLYVITLYAATRPVSYFKVKSEVTTTIVQFDTHMKSLRFNLGEVHAHTPTTSLFIEECERLLLQILGVETTGSVTSSIILKLLKTQKDIAKLKSVANSTQKGAILQVEGKAIFNI